LKLYKFRSTVTVEMTRSNNKGKEFVMLKRALNHMAAPKLSWAEFLNLAKSLNCIGVEFRNDLPGDLFDGDSPDAVGTAVKEANLRILALAEIKSFNDWSDAKNEEAIELMSIAKACGAEKVSLIASNDKKSMSANELVANLDTALRELKPLLEQHSLVGLIEPLGFETSTLRDKADAVKAIDAIGAQDRFCIVHDTFHHYAAGGGAIFPEHTGIVHISGVVKSNLDSTDLRDEYRVLIDEYDVLGNVDQLASLLKAGYEGPISFEPFSPEVLTLADASKALAKSFTFIEENMQ
jgi:2-keto-myo-inositol isomerase